MHPLTEMAAETIKEAAENLQTRLAAVDRELDPERFQELRRIDPTKAMIEVPSDELREYLQQHKATADPTLYRTMRRGLHHAGEATEVYVQACDVLAIAKNAPTRMETSPAE